MAVRALNRVRQGVGCGQPTKRTLGHAKPAVRVSVFRQCVTVSVVAGFSYSFDVGHRKTGAA
jgi:hypothetical protein